MANVEIMREDGTVQVKLMFHDEEGNPLDDILTKQCFLEDCDINTIIDRHVKAGTVPQVYVDGSYADVSDITTLQDAAIRVEEAHGMFDALPAKVRSRFENDTFKFLDFVGDPSNYDEMVKMGLVDPQAPSEDGDSVSKSVDSVNTSGKGSEQ